MMQRSADITVSQRQSAEEQVQVSPVLQGGRSDLVDAWHPNFCPGN